MNDMNSVSPEEAAFRAVVWDNPYLITRSVQKLKELKEYLDGEVVTPPGGGEE